eukprot:5308617-Pyramimonas_sp.AAC.1
MSVSSPTASHPFAGIDDTDTVKIDPLVIFDDDDDDDGDGDDDDDDDGNGANDGDDDDADDNDNDNDDDDGNDGDDGGDDDDDDDDEGHDDDNDDGNNDDSDGVTVPVSSTAGAEGDAKVSFGHSERRGLAVRAAVRRQHRCQLAHPLW